MGEDSGAAQPRGTQAKDRQRFPIGGCRIRETAVCACTRVSECARACILERKGSCLSSEPKRAFDPKGVKKRSSIMKRFKCV